jgi:hypothetical protein
MTDEEERAGFEAWAADEGGFGRSQVVRVSEDYVFPMVRFAWLGWRGRASALDALVSQTGVPVIPRELIDRIDAIVLNAWHMGVSSGIDGESEGENAQRRAHETETRFREMREDLRILLTTYVGVRRADEVDS